MDPITQYILNEDKRKWSDHCDIPLHKLKNLIPSAVIKKLQNEVLKKMKAERGAKRVNLKRAELSVLLGFKIYLEFETDMKETWGAFIEFKPQITNSYIMGGRS